MMSVAQVEQRVSRIAAIARGESDEPSTDAAAHQEEDSLFREVLAAIAEGARDAPCLAAAALKSAAIPFSRWYE
jgi:hypothetical protein